MAAAALCEVLGGTPEQVLMAAEIHGTPSRIDL
jgi:L-serine deaminase